MTTGEVLREWAEVSGSLEIRVCIEENDGLFSASMAAGFIFSLLENVFIFFLFKKKTFL